MIKSLKATQISERRCTANCDPIAAIPTRVIRPMWQHLEDNHIKEFCEAKTSGFYCDD